MKNNEIDTESRAYKFARGKGVMNLPNKLTISRVLMIPVFVLFFYLNFTAHYFVALGIFILACLTDFLDGMIARKYNLVTNLGKFLDPIADKVLVLTALVVYLTKPGFVVATLGSIGIVAMGCGVAVILAREIIISGFRLVAVESSGEVIPAGMIGKYKTTFQDISIVVLLVGAGMYELCEVFADNAALNTATTVINYIGFACLAIAIILTIISGVHYIVKNIKVLKQ